MLCHWRIVNEIIYNEIKILELSPLQSNPTVFASSVHDIELFNSFLDFSSELNPEETLSSKKAESAISRVSLNMTCVNAWLNFAGCVKKWSV